jgi:subtilisin family serine protease
MKKLDARLRLLLEANVLWAEHAVAEHISERVVTNDRAGGTQVEVLVSLSAGAAAVAALEAAGFELEFLVPGVPVIAGGQVPVTRLPDLEALEHVIEVEASRRLSRHLDVSREETRVAAVQSSAAGPRGDGVVIGLVDDGIDFTHPDFRAADGSSRVLFLWDQGGDPPAGDNPVPYGREYTKADLDAALATADPFARVPSRNVNGHGSVTAGIAAGDGQASAGRFTGMAPGAGLIVVAYRMEDSQSLGTSARAVAGYDYIVRKARSLNRPVVINQSEGMNGGGHCGETLLETAIDSILRAPGVVGVKAAGNERTEQTHASGLVAQGATVTREFTVLSNNKLNDIFEVWFDGGDELAVAVEPPGGTPLAFVPFAHQQAFTTTAGNRVSVDSDPDASNTGDTRVTIILVAGDSAFIQPGLWRLHLRGDTVRGSGRFDVWIERSFRGPGVTEQARFTSASADPVGTVTIPGTARRILTVGSYVTRPYQSVSEGLASEFSSAGPTRYGLTKPELVAPGQYIRAARSSQSPGTTGDPDSLFNRYSIETGTSMAAPHVAGAVVLILEKQPDLSCDQVRQILTRSARHDPPVAAVPDDRYGYGKLDAEAALTLADTARFPVILEPKVAGKVISWKTDIPTTGAVRISTNQRQLQLGKSQSSRAILVFQTEHSVDLGDLGDQDHFVEIIAFSQDNWSTTEDNGGNLFTIGG